MDHLGRNDGAASARAALLAAGADALERRPWQHPNELPDDTSLVRFALWRASGSPTVSGSPTGNASSEDARTAEIAAALALLDSARSDLDALETALVFTARAEGLTWARIAEAMGLRSPQAAQQRFQRTSERPVTAGHERSEKDAGHGEERRR